MTFQGWGNWIPALGATVKDGQYTAEFRSGGHAAASQRAEIYSVPWGGGTAQLVRQAQDSTIERMGVSEDGAELVVAIGRYGSATGPSYPYANCEFQYWGAVGSLPVKNSFPTVPHVCRWFNENAGGFSAVVAGMGLTGQPQMRRSNSLSTLRLFDPRAAQKRLP
jgi:hypothetical protein